MPETSGTMVEFKANGDIAPGYLARPNKEGSFPGVVVIQEWWGLDDHIRSVTDRAARAGFVALAPDLYRGKLAEEPDEARKLAMGMNADQVFKDIQGAVDFLRAQLFVEPKKIGVMGFCMGGRLAGEMGFRGRDVGAVVSFYGAGLDLSGQNAANLSAPFLGLYGEEDQGCPPSKVREWDEVLTAANKVHALVSYPEAGHAFFNDTRPSYRPAAAEDAWARAMDWFHKYLQGEG